MVFTVRHAFPWPRKSLFYKLSANQGVRLNLIDSNASLQSSHGFKLNTIAWVVELTYLHVVVKRESLLGGESKACCTVTLVSANQASRNSGLGPVSRKFREVFGPEKPFVKLQPAYSVKLVF